MGACVCWCAGSSPRSLPHSFLCVIVCFCVWWVPILSSAIALCLFYEVRTLSLRPTCPLLCQCSIVELRVGTWVVHRSPQPRKATCGVGTGCTFGPAVWRVCVGGTGYHAGAGAFHCQGLASFGLHAGAGPPPSHPLLLLPGSLFLRRRCSGCFPGGSQACECVKKLSM